MFLCTATTCLWLATIALIEQKNYYLTLNDEASAKEIRNIIFGLRLATVIMKATLVTMVAWVVFVSIPDSQLPGFLRKVPAVGQHTHHKRG
jgi:hypothetical protein